MGVPCGASPAHAHLTLEGLCLPPSLSLVQAQSLVEAQLRTPYLSAGFSHRRFTCFNAPKDVAPKDGGPASADDRCSCACLVPANVSHEHTLLIRLLRYGLSSYSALRSALVVMALAPMRAGRPHDRKQEAYNSVRDWRLGAAEAIEATPAVDISRGRLGDRYTLSSVSVALDPLLLSGCILASVSRHQQPEGGLALGVQRFPHPLGCREFRPCLTAQHHHPLPSVGASHLPKQGFGRAGLRMARSAAAACWWAMPRTP